MIFGFFSQPTGGDTAGTFRCWHGNDTALAGGRVVHFAVIGDALMMLASFWVVAFGTQSRRWVAPTVSQVIVFLGLGLAVTLSIEHFASHAIWGWQRSPLMPIEPWLGVALDYVLMAMIVPLVLLWFGNLQQCLLPVEKVQP